VSLILLLLALVSCDTPDPVFSVKAVPSGVEAQGAGSATLIDTRGVSGSVISRWVPQSDVETVWFPVDWSKHDSIQVQAHIQGAIQTTNVTGPETTDTLRIAVPLGQDVRVLRDGSTVVYPTLGDESPQVGISLTSMDNAPVEIRVGDTVHTEPNPVFGQRVSLSSEMDGSTDVEVRLGSTVIKASLQAAPIDIVTARSQVSIVDIRYPTDSRGNADLARPRGVIGLPSRWWAALLSHFRIGIRPHDRTVPWAYASVQIRNDSDVPLNLSARMRVTQDGSPDPDFIPTMRDVDDGTGWVSVQFRVLASDSSTVSLPLYVDERALGEENRGRSARAMKVEVSAIGSGSTLADENLPLHVQRGSSFAALGVLLGLVGSLGGLILIASRLRAWLSLPTSTLVTIALFSTLSFVVNAAAQLLGMGISGVLGPFAFLVSGLIDETIRACLLATLLILRPKPGVCALTVLVGWLMRSVIMGMGGPADLLYLTGHVMFLEGSLWLCGLTRGRDLTFLRIGAALAMCFSVSILAALSFNVVLYRLFYASWYIGLNVVMSGLVFPFVGAWLAVPFAWSLQRVED